MSDLTVIQLLSAQRARDLRKNQQIGIVDVIAFPMFCIFASCMVVLLLVKAVVVLAGRGVFTVKTGMAKLSRTEANKT